MRFVLWCAFILLIALALRKKIKLWVQHQKNQHRADTQTQVEMRDKHPEAMLACAHCGMYIPASEVIKHTDAETNNDVVFCSVVHRQQYFSV
jgi:Pyruvate/2-oxoacid:ferredoxin oxidoreductase delta subunit